MGINLKGINILNSDVNIYDLDYDTYYFEDILMRLTIRKGCIRFSKIGKEKLTEVVSINYNYTNNYEKEYNRFDMFNNIFYDTKDYSVKNFFENWSSCDIEIINVYRRSFKTCHFFNPFLKPNMVNLEKKLNNRKVSNAILTGQLANCKYHYRYTDDYYYDAQVNYMIGREYEIGELAKRLIEDSFCRFKIEKGKLYAYRYHYLALVMDIV